MQLSNARLYASVFLISMASLVYEILITRIFSATTWYHFAFLSISSAMLGLAFGAILVYMRENLFRPEAVEERMSQSALVFAVMSIVGVMVHVDAPMFFKAADPFSLITLSLAAAFPFILTAFTAVGVCICLALTRFPSIVAKTYAFDLLGAALGCIVAVVLMNQIDALTDVFIAGLIGAFVALILGKQRIPALVLVVLIGGLVVAQIWGADSRTQPFRVGWTKGYPDSDVVYEKWNALSRIRVLGNPNKDIQLTDPTLSNRLRGMPHKILDLDIDGLASTNMVQFDGKDKAAVNFMQSDLTAMAHHVRSNADVLIIGMGAGRDVLSAITANQHSVLAIEINQATVNAVNKVFGDFTGHLDQYPGVTLINDEARSTIARLNAKYDIIQASLIDTWAASSSGAYAMAENSLYTVECWKILLEHLKPNGILIVTRWFEPHSPAEFYRLTSLAVSALNQVGVTDYRDHIIVIRNVPSKAVSKYNRQGIGSLMVCRSAFSDTDIQTIEQQCVKDGFQLVMSPKSSQDEILSGLVNAATNKETIDQYPFNINAPTDDSPFFFQMFRLNKLQENISNPGKNTIQVMAGVMPVFALVLFAFVLYSCVRLPQILKGPLSRSKGSGYMLLYFYLIGQGFMLIEMAQVQRFVIFLGHPSYGLSVVLFALLLSTGLGSYIINGFADSAQNNLRRCFQLLLVVLLVFGLAFVPVLNSCLALPTLARIGLSVALMIPAGMVLGMAFPLGMYVSAQRPQLTPWLWGINGAASVVGSILSVILAMTVGLKFTYWAGFVSYIFAALTLIKTQRVLSGWVENAPEEASTANNSVSSQTGTDGTAGSTTT